MLKLNYNLPRAGPKNLKNFVLKNYFPSSNMPPFDYTSRGVADINKLAMDKIVAIELDPKTNEGNQPLIT